MSSLPGTNNQDHADGRGEHFHQHAVELGLDVKNDMDKIMENCNIVIVPTVEPGQPWCKTMEYV